MASLRTVERIDRELGLEDRLHLRPDESLASRIMVNRLENPEDHLTWLERW